MSVRVVARVRPLLKAEIEKDVIVEAVGEREGEKTTVRMPNPKNESEAFSFQFNSVWDSSATQAEIFDKEIAPTAKHLFKGYNLSHVASAGIMG